MNNKKMLIVLCLFAAVLIAGIVFVTTLDHHPIDIRADRVQGYVRVHMC